MSDEQLKPIKFASVADMQAWETDMACFGRAVVTADGKHVPLNDLDVGLLDGYKGQVGWTTLAVGKVVSLTLPDDMLD